MAGWAGPKVLNENNVDLSRPIDVRPVSAIMLIAPAGEPVGRLAGLMSRVQRLAGATGLASGRPGAVTAPPATPSLTSTTLAITWLSSALGRRVYPILGHLDLGVDRGVFLE